MQIDSINYSLFSDMFPNNFTLMKSHFEWSVSVTPDSLLSLYILISSEQPENCIQYLFKIYLQTAGAQAACLTEGI